MSGTLLKHQGRTFWSKYLVDIWTYHLAYLVFQDENSEQWLLDWAESMMPFAANFFPDFMFDFETTFVSDEQVALLIQLNQRVLERLNHYDEFLAQEKMLFDIARVFVVPNEKTVSPPVQKILDIVDAFDKTKKFSHNNHLEIINRFTTLKMSHLKTFGYLLIKMYTGENWYPAYHDSYAQASWVAAIDYLEMVKPDGDVGHGRIMSIRGNQRMSYLVRENNPDPKIDWQSGYPKYEGIPDLMLLYQTLEENQELDDLELDIALQENYREQWLLDLEKRIVLQVSTLGIGFASRYPAEADFYSPVLDKLVNLASIFDAEKQ